MDADFVLSGHVQRGDLDRAMADAGFTRRSPSRSHVNSV